MESYMDDYESYKRYNRNCTCGCYKHCGFSCMTDDCECTDCECPDCVDGQGYN
jgi:hypothetical protein